MNNIINQHINEADIYNPRKKDKEHWFNPLRIVFGVAGLGMLVKAAEHGFIAYGELFDKMNAQRTRDGKMGAERGFSNQLKTEQSETGSTIKTEPWMLPKTSSKADLTKFVQPKSNLLTQIEKDRLESNRVIQRNVRGFLTDKQGQFVPTKQIEISQKKSDIISKIRKLPSFSVGPSNSAFITKISKLFIEQGFDDLDVSMIDPHEVRITAYVKGNKGTSSVNIDIPLTTKEGYIKRNASSLKHWSFSKKTKDPLFEQSSAIPEILGYEQALLGNLRAKLPTIRTDLQHGNIDRAQRMASNQLKDLSRSLQTTTGNPLRDKFIGSSVVDKEIELISGKYDDQFVRRQQELLKELKILKHIVKSGKPYVVIDTESVPVPGSYAKIDKQGRKGMASNMAVVELGMVKSKGGKVVDEFHTFLQPAKGVLEDKSSFDWHKDKKTGLEQDIEKMGNRLPVANAALGKKVKDFIKDSTIIGASIKGHDIPEIERLFEGTFKIKRSETNIVDITRVSRYFFHWLKKRGTSIENLPHTVTKSGWKKLSVTQESLQEYFNKINIIEKLQHPHRALGDAKSETIVAEALSKHPAFNDFIKYVESRTTPKNVKFVSEEVEKRIHDLMTKGIRLPSGEFQKIYFQASGPEQIIKGKGTTEDPGAYIMHPYMSDVSKRYDPTLKGRMELSTESALKLLSHGKNKQIFKRAVVTQQMLDSDPFLKGLSEGMAPEALLKQGLRPSFLNVPVFITSSGFVAESESLVSGTFFGKTKWQKPFDKAQRIQGEYGTLPHLDPKIYDALQKSKSSKSLIDQNIFIDTGDPIGVDASGNIIKYSGKYRARVSNVIKNAKLGYVELFTQEQMPVEFGSKMALNQQFGKSTVNPLLDKERLEQFIGKIQGLEDPVFITQGDFASKLAEDPQTGKLVGRTAAGGMLDMLSSTAIEKIIELGQGDKLLQMFEKAGFKGFQIKNQMLIVPKEYTGYAGREYTHSFSSFLTMNLQQLTKMAKLPDDFKVTTSTGAEGYWMKGQLVVLDKMVRESLTPYYNVTPEAQRAMSGHGESGDVINRIINENYNIEKTARTIEYQKLIESIEVPFQKKKYLENVKSYTTEDLIKEGGLDKLLRKKETTRWFKSKELRAKDLKNIWRMDDIVFHDPYEARSYAAERGLDPDLNKYLISPGSRFIKADITGTIKDPQGKFSQGFYWESPIDFKFKMGEQQRQITKGQKIYIPGVKEFPMWESPTGEMFGNDFDKSQIDMFQAATNIHAAIRKGSKQQTLDNLRDQLSDKMSKYFHGSTNLVGKTGELRRGVLETKLPGEWGTLKSSVLYSKALPDYLKKIIGGGKVFEGVEENEILISMKTAQRRYSKELIDSIVKGKVDHYDAIQFYSAVSKDTFYAGKIKIDTQNILKGVDVPLIGSSIIERGYRDLDGDTAQYLTSPKMKQKIGDDNYELVQLNLKKILHKQISKGGEVFNQELKRKEGLRFLNEGFIVPKFKYDAQGEAIEYLGKEWIPMKDYIKQYGPVKDTESYKNLGLVGTLQNLKKVEDFQYAQKEQVQGVVKLLRQQFQTGSLTRLMQTIDEKADSMGLLKDPEMKGIFGSITGEIKEIAVQEKQVHQGQRKFSLGFDEVHNLIKRISTEPDSPEVLEQMKAIMERRTYTEKTSQAYKDTPKKVINIFHQVLQKNPNLQTSMKEYFSMNPTPDLALEKGLNLFSEETYVDLNLKRILEAAGHEQKYTKQDVRESLTNKGIFAKMLDKDQSQMIKAARHSKAAGLFAMGSMIFLSLAGSSSPIDEVGEKEGMSDEEMENVSLGPNRLEGPAALPLPIPLFNFFNTTRIRGEDPYKNWREDVRDMVKSGAFSNSNGLVPEPKLPRTVIKSDRDDRRRYVSLSSLINNKNSLGSY